MVALDDGDDGMRKPRPLHPSHVELTHLYPAKTCSCDNGDGNDHADAIGSCDVNTESLYLADSCMHKH